jgi:hypothetical protein
MDSYRQLQAEKWQRNAINVEPPIVEPISDAPPLIKQQPPALKPEQEERISIVAVDSTSLESIKTFLKESDGLIPRYGILFGTIGEDGYTIIVDAIYEASQDVITGKFLRDSRQPMVTRVAAVMELRPVGILIAKISKNLTASDLIQVAQLPHAAAHALLLMSTVGPDFQVTGFVPTKELFEKLQTGQLTEGTTLTGKTVNGGLDGMTLYKSVAVVTRALNDVIHNGFYRLNRPNHTPTLEDAKAFIAVRREKAKITEMYLQIADFHLLLFLADELGEETAHRAILAIHQKEDELIEDLMASSDAW